MVGIVFLILIGLLLIVAELIFVPGTTFVGVMGLLLTIVGIFIVFADYGDTAGYWTTGGALVITIATIVYSFQSKSWEKFSLKSINKFKVNGDDNYNLQVGERGKTISDLKPVGKAEINSQVLEVRSNGKWIGAGENIEIIRIENKKIIVNNLK